MTHDIESFQNHEFEIFEYPDDDYPLYNYYYYYRIYPHKNYKDYIESEGNMFEAPEEARFAAVGHILKIIEKELMK